MGDILAALYSTGDDKGLTSESSASLTGKGAIGDDATTIFGGEGGASAFLYRGRGRGRRAGVMLVEGSIRVESVDGILLQQRLPL